MKRLVVGLVGSLLAFADAFAQTTAKAGSPIADDGPDVSSGLTTAAMIGIPVILLILVALLQPWQWFQRPKNRRHNAPSPEVETSLKPIERRPYFPQPTPPEKKSDS
jgi:hypothetical protein